MSTIFKYRFDSELNILYKNYFGLISIEDIFVSWEHAFNNNVIPEETKGVILDFRKANFDFKVDRFVDIASFYKKHIRIFKGMRIASISVEPSDVVIPMMVKTRDEGYSSEPFSTEEAAINWILS